MNNTYQVIKDFEERIALFCGSPYAVAVDSCSNALLLACVHANVKDIPEIILPSRTYPSAPCAIIHAGGRIKFEDFNWHGQYYFRNTNIIDSAPQLTRNMYLPGTLMCISFHGKKPLPIGRGGAILTDSLEAVEHLKTLRFDGRHETSLMEDTLACVGYNCYMTPEQASRGMVLLDFFEGGIKNDPYPDLSGYKMYTEANR